MTTHWVLEPRDPLVFRDGRPNVGRSAPRLRPFALPSTVAGACRTRVGSGERGFSVPEGRLDELLRVPVRGPLLVDRDRGTLYVPPPSDATLFRDDAGRYLLRGVRPAQMPTDARVDHDLGDLQLLLMDDPPSAKPDRSLRFWALDSALAWLLGDLEPNAMACPRHELVDGLEGLPTESRTHVALGPGGTAREGFLFESEGLRFEVAREHDGRRHITPLGLHLEVGAFDGRDVQPGIAPLGGERRLVRWRASEPLWPAAPGRVLDFAAAGEEATLRVHLLTPGLFEGGWRPGSQSPLLASESGLDATLVAASVGPPLSVSGWSLRERQPKPSRRAAPAGSVYWVRLRGSAEARRRWVEENWMQNVSCREQDRLDGWGLALIGVQR